MFTCFFLYLIIVISNVQKLYYLEGYIHQFFFVVQNVFQFIDFNSTNIESLLYWYVNIKSVMAIGGLHMSRHQK